MTVSWDIWLGFVFLAISSSVLMAEGVIRLRIAHGKKWKALCQCVASLVMCLGIAIGAYLMSHSIDNLVRTLKSPSPPSSLRADWGAEWSKEDRWKYSQMLARISFENWGASVQYFDLDGTMHFYKPTEVDRENRAVRLRYIAQSEKASALMIWTMFVCFLLPWIGLAASFSPLSERVCGTLTGRLKPGAQQSGNALS